jgi:hypothetical protein
MDVIVLCMERFLLAMVALEAASIGQATAAWKCLMAGSIC